MKRPITIIDTFKSIYLPKNKKPIVICDIDLTFIRPANDYIDIYNKFKSSFSRPTKLHKFVHDAYRSINVGEVKQTDSDGFIQMLERIKHLGGKFVFLTARHYLSNNKTINDLKTAGLQNAEEFIIHYTGNKINKSQYIQRFNLLQGYDHYVFIDDYPSNLEYALQIYPDMNCYWFKYK